MKKRLMVVLTVLFALVLGLGVLSACGGDDDEGGSGDGVKLNVTELTLGVNDTSNLSATSSVKGDINWTTSNESAVQITSQVHKNGIAFIRAVGEGVSTLTATDAAGKSATCTVTVEDLKVVIEGAENGKVTIYRDLEDHSFEAKTLKAKVVTSSGEEKKGDQVTWTSSNEEVVTVEGGVLTAHSIGESTITVKRAKGNQQTTVTVEVKWEGGETPAGWYSIIHGGKSAATGENAGKWAWTGDEGWGNSTPTVRGDGWDDKGSVTLDIEGNTGWRWYGVQLFYTNPNLLGPDDDGKFFKLTLKIDSSIESYITINDTQVKLNEGSNDVTVYYYQAKLDSDNNPEASIHINLAWHDILRNSVNPSAENGVDLKFEEGRLDLSDLTWTEFTPEKLATPTAFSIAADKEITVTDTNTDKEKIEGYVIGFYQDGEEKYTLPVMKPFEGKDILENRGGVTYLPNDQGQVDPNAGKMYLDDSFLAAGTYDLKVKAYSGVARYADSDWFDVSEPYTKTGKAEYDVLASYRDVDRGVGRYYVWSEWDKFILSGCKYANDALTLTVDGEGDWYSNQVIYKAAGLTVGKEYVYKFTFNATTIPASKDEQPKELDLTGRQFVINGQRINPTKGVQEVSVSFTYNGGTAITMLLGKPNEDFSATVTDSGLPQGVYTFSNIEIKDMDEVREEKDGGVMTFGDNLNGLTDKLMYWFATDGSWTNPGDGSWRAEGVDLNNWGHDVNAASDTGHSYWFDYKVKAFDGKYCSWISRFWYKNSRNVSGSEYKLEITIDSNEAGEAIINGQNVHIEKGEKTYTVYYTEGQIHVNDYEPPLNASLFIVLATENSMMGMDEDGIRITFKSIKWTAGGKEQLADPTATLADGTVTITSGKEGVDHFEIGLFDSAEAASPVSTQNIASGEKIIDAQHYNGTYTVKIRACGDADHKDSAWVTLGQYTVTNGTAVRLGGEDDSLTNKDNWYIWADHWNWCGSQVTVNSSSADETAKKFAIDYSTTGNPSLGYSVQLFYKNSANVAGTLYKLTFKIKSSTPGSVTVNGTIIELTANTEKEVTVSYTEDSKKASFSLQAGIDRQPESAIMSSKIEISEWKWENVTQKTLATPTNFAIGADNKISFTDPNTAGVKGYQLAFFKGNDMYQIFSVQNGDTLNTSTVFKGTYSVKVQALGDNAEYLTSGWSDGVQKEVTADPSYALTTKVGNSDPMYTFFYWRQWNNGIENAKFENGKLSFDMVNEGNWDSHQIFYKLNVPGKATFTVKLNSTIEGKKIVINSTIYELKKGDQTITIENSDITFALFMGEPQLPDWKDTASSVDSGSFVFSDFLWTMADGTQYNLQGKIS